MSTIRQYLHLTDILSIIDRYKHNRAWANANNRRTRPILGSMRWERMARSFYLFRHGITAGFTCIYLNDFYSQCQPSGASSTSTLTTTPCPKPTIPIIEPAKPGGQCGGNCWMGPFNCPDGYRCFPLDNNTSLCQNATNTRTQPPTSAPTRPTKPTSEIEAPTPTPPMQSDGGQCGGKGWPGPTVCKPPITCVVLSPDKSQCQTTKTKAIPTRLIDTAQTVLANMRV
ncbi:hypothetical protein BXZ70DRAFT_1013082 [Cristinia sonorae]|uniref:CBM1 domain-containing protein n=1 Tax=Cristinia sonorae TaxID=1940300 RepID=A0A8K0XJN1_9AGAR|nr:hypothetical protein BXZ70DRAFT_1013082 [Cristinia sonorae]